MTGVDRNVGLHRFDDRRVVQGAAAVVQARLVDFVYDNIQTAATAPGNVATGNW